MYLRTPTVGNKGLETVLVVGVFLIFRVFEVFTDWDLEKKLDIS